MKNFASCLSSTVNGLKFVDSMVKLAGFVEENAGRLQHHLKLGGARVNEDRVL
jgi:hypothetical protein